MARHEDMVRTAPQPISPIQPTPPILSIHSIHPVLNSARS